eukprot:scaffold165723_cov27-Tisochrysis_lutea.AAC.3
MADAPCIWQLRASTSLSSLYTQPRPHRYELPGRRLASGTSGYVQRCSTSRLITSYVCASCTRAAYSLVITCVYMVLPNISNWPRIPAKRG